MSCLLCLYYVILRIMSNMYSPRQ